MIPHLALINLANLVKQIEISTAENTPEFKELRKGLTVDSWTKIPVSKQRSMVTLPLNYRIRTKGHGDIVRYNSIIPEESGPVGRIFYKGGSNPVDDESSDIFEEVKLRFYEEVSINGTLIPPSSIIVRAEIIGSWGDKRFSRKDKDYGARVDLREVIHTDWFQK